MSTGKAFDRKLVSYDIIFFCLIPCVSWLIVLAIQKDCCCKSVECLIFFVVVRTVNS